MSVKTPRDTLSTIIENSKVVGRCSEPTLRARGAARPKRAIVITKRKSNYEPSENYTFAL